MHYLHPRSRTTGTLFTTTLAISFLVVGIPHLLPCPVDRRQFADSYETPDGRVMRRKKRKNTAEEDLGEQEIETVGDGRPKRECPVPKPGGLVGQIMGFNNIEHKERLQPKEVIVHTLDKRPLRRAKKQDTDTDTP